MFISYCCSCSKDTPFVNRQEANSCKEYMKVLCDDSNLILAAIESGNLPENTP